MHEVGIDLGPHADPGGGHDDLGHQVGRIACKPEPRDAALAHLVDGHVPANAGYLLLRLQPQRFHAGNVDVEVQHDHQGIERTLRSVAEFQRPAAIAPRPTQLSPPPPRLEHPEPPAVPIPGRQGLCWGP